MNLDVLVSERISPSMPKVRDQLVRAVSIEDESGLKQCVDSLLGLLEKIKQLEWADSLPQPYRARVRSGHLNVSTVELVAEGQARSAKKEVCYLLAFAYGKLGVTDEAIKYAQISINTDANNPNAYYVLSFVYLCTEEFDKAIDAATETIRLNPENLDGYYNRAAANIHIGNFREARADFDEYFQNTEVLSLGARTFNLYLNLVENELETVVSTARGIIRNIKKVETGEEFFAYLGAHACLGEAYRRQGEKLKAEDHFKLAISAKNTIPLGFYNVDLRLIGELVESGLQKL